MSEHVTNPTPGAALSVRRLTLRLPGGRVLLENANLDVQVGEFVLLVGPSGSGKSTLLNLVAGFRQDADSNIEVTGEILQNNSRDARNNIGLVFQQLALFDELSPQANVQFAIDHRDAAGPAQPGEAQQRLRDLGVPATHSLRALSGGERQRVAVARTLAMDPPILLFDEPITGLDPQRVRDVTRLIAEVHDGSNKTTVVVTHDYEPFLEQAPRIILLDPEQRSLREVSVVELQAFFERDGVPDPATESAALAASRHVQKWLDDPGRVLATLLGALLAPWDGWRHPRWMTRYLVHYLRMVLLGPTAIYVAIAGAMLGFVTIFFGFSKLPYASVTMPLLTEELLSAGGSISFRVLVPLLTTVLVAAKCGAAISADIGARRLTQQFEALRSFGVRPAAYLYGNIVIALVVGTPILCLIAYGTTCYASLVAFLMTAEDGSVLLFRRNFFAASWPHGTLLPNGYDWFALKTALCGCIIAGLSYAIGSRPKRSSVDVSRDVGLTIFWATLAVLGTHTALAFLEF